MNKRVSWNAVPYAWLAIAALFLLRAPHPAASGSVDPDVYWHLLYGHEILRSGTIPTADAWSWTLVGKPYHLTQWLGEVLIAFAEQIGGELGKQAFAALLITTTIAFAYRASRCYLPNRTAAISVALLCCIVQVSMTCRPHQFTFLGLAALSWILAVHNVTGKIKPLLIVPPMMALWVNLHGGYAFALVYLCLVIGANTASAFVRHEWPSRRREIFWLSGITFVSFLATALNPYGVDVWAQTAAVGALKSVSNGVTGEWIPTNIRTNLGFAFFMVSLATTMALAFSDRRPGPRDALLVIALFFFGWWAIRMTIFVSILLVPIISQFFGDTPFYRLAFQDREQTEGRLSALKAITALLVIALIGIVGGRTDTAVEARVRREFPVEETKYLQDKHFAGRIMNTMEAGGYLIKHMGIPVFLDTRLDLYGDDYFFAFMDAAAGGDQWRQFIEKYDPDVVMIEHDMPLKNLLLQAQMYRVGFTGPRYTVLERNPIGQQ